MQELLERLGRGDGRIMEMCARANTEWRAFFAELDGADIGTLAARLGFFQRNIQGVFDSKTLGESMMAWSAFGCLYDTQNGWAGNERRALDLCAAFARSNCSPEVKSEARSAAISYGLDLHPDFPREAMAQASVVRSNFAGRQQRKPERESMF